MADTIAPGPAIAVHPLQAFLLASAVPLFLGALLSDIAYAVTYQIQWSNFAAWLLLGAMVFTGLSLLWSLIDLLRVRRKGRRAILFALLLAAFVLGLIDNFVHARDAWGMMPDGLFLTAVVTATMIAATWLAFRGPGRGAVR